MIKTESMSLNYNYFLEFEQKIKLRIFR